ncbi:MAG: YCF48-related protein, partial [Bacteroidota bacterium]
SDYLPMANSNWRYPVNYDALTLAQVSTHYREDDGTESHVTVFEIATNVYIPEPNTGVIPTWDPLTSSYWIYPEGLKYLSDFISKWKPSWAKSLVGYHPEFCLYSLCKSYDNVPAGFDNSSTDFDDRLVMAQSFADASALPDPLINTAGTVMFGDDPFLSNTLYPFYANSLLYRMNHYQVSGGMDLSMLEFATFIAHCGTQYGNTPNPACFDFTTLTAPDELDDVWSTFKSLYLSEKRKLKYARYKALYAESCMYNDCIGNDHFNWYTAGMWRFPWWTSPVLHPGQQPCAWSTYHNYTHKAKRFISPQDALDMGDQDDVELQMYYQTGQCPMAFHLQNFLTGLITDDLLDNTNVDLSTVDAFSPKLYNVLNGTLDPPYNIYTWNATVAGNLLDIAIKDPNGVTVCTLHLDKSAFPNTVSWDDISGISQLHSNGMAGPNFLFTCVADFISVDNNGASTVLHYSITGYSSCFDIDGCTFPQECDLNDLGADVNSLLSVLAFNDSLIITPIVLTPTFTPFITTQIANVLGVPVTSGFSYSGTAGATIDIKIWATSNPLKYIHLVADVFDPATFTAFSTIKLIDNFAPKYQNGFEFDGLDLMQNLLVHAEGTSTLVNNGGVTMLPLGKCQVAEPLACQTTENQLMTDLEALLTSVTWNTYSSNWTTLDLSANPNFTYLLDDFLPPANPAGNNEEEGGAHTDTLNIDFGDCGFVLFGDTAPGGIPIHDITNLVSITAPLIPAGQPDESGNYYSFLAAAVYAGGQTGYVYGTTCLPLKNCDPCPWQTDTTPPIQSRLTGDNNNTGRKERAGKEEEVKRDPNLIAYNNESFESLVSGFNRFYPSPTDNRRITTNLFKNERVFKNAVTEQDLDGYTKYIQSCAVRSANLTVAPKNILEWKEERNTILSGARPVTNSGTLAREGGEVGNTVVDPCVDWYGKYIDYIHAYNASAWAISHGHQLLDNLFVDYNDFQNKGFCPCVNIYIEYIESYITNSVPAGSANPVSILDFPGCPKNCSEYYAQYLQTIAAYNASSWAVAHSHTLSLTLFANFQSFYNRGYCSCVKLYMDYLLKYINGNMLPNDPMPSDIGNWTEGCNPVSQENCRAAYEDYIKQIDTYNSSAWAIAHNSILIKTIFPDYISFYNSGYCFCVKAYMSYLQQFINGSMPANSAPPVAITLWSGCGVGPSNENDPCETNYQLYLQTITDYNNSAFAIASGHQLSANLFSGYQEFYSKGFCSCVRLYITMLQQFINGAYPVGTTPPDDIKRWKDCDPLIGNPCNINFERYIATLNAFNQSAWAISHSYYLSTTLFANYTDFYNQGYCYCALAYISYLSPWINGTADPNGPNPVPITQWNGCGSIAQAGDTCKYNYKAYQTAIHNYNLSNYAVTTGYYLNANLFGSYAEFYERGFCSCVRLYLNMLQGYIDGSIPPSATPPVDIINWEGCIPVVPADCREDFNKYLDVIHAYNSNLPSGCPALSDHLFIDYIDFYNQGYCYCVKAYIEYINTFLNQTAISVSSICAIPITQWEGCGHQQGDTCKNNYATYLASVVAYNVSAYATTTGIYLNPNSFSGYQEFFDKGFCSCVRLYINMLQAYINGTIPVSDPGPKEIREWENCNPVNQGDCEKPYNDDYLPAIAAYNASAWATSNGHSISPSLFTGYMDFYNQGYCWCMKKYIDYLNNYTNGGVAPGSPNPLPITQWEGCGHLTTDTCTLNYASYLATVNAYNLCSYAIATGNYLNPNSFSGYQEFFDRGFCSCVRLYINMLQDYINGLIPITNAGPVDIRDWEKCSPIRDCKDDYNLYLDVIHTYNSNLPPNCPPLDEHLFIDDDDFYNQGYCYCVKAYIEYINSFFNQSAIQVASICAVPITEWEGCGHIHGDTCKQNYTAYLAAVNAYNVCSYATTTGNYLNPNSFSGYQEFFNKGYCSCVRLYINMLQDYINGLMPVSAPGPGDIREWENCNPIDEDHCLKPFDIYNSTIDAYNASSWALSHGHSISTTIFTDYTDFYNQGYCWCVKAYSDYLNAYINGSVGSSAPNPVPITQWSGCGHNPADTCKNNYVAYLAAVNAYNTSAYAIATGNYLNPNSFSGYQEFYDKGFCSCVRLYINLLQDYINGSMPVTSSPPQEIRDWVNCSPVDPNMCVDSYNAYVQAIIDYNNSTWSSVHGHTLPNIFVDYFDFYDQGYCWCVQDYLNYLNAYTNGSASPASPNPSAITMWVGCGYVSPDTCKQNYLSYLTAVAAYNASAYAVTTGHYLNQNSFSSYLEFFNGGYCSCVRLYINMLQAYINGSIPVTAPAPVDIRNWSSCVPVNPEQCRISYDNYLLAITAYNGSTWSSTHAHTLSGNLFIDYHDFYTRGYCWCVQDYLNYLNSYTSGTVAGGSPNPLPITQWQGCIIIEDTCEALYSSYQAAVAAYNASAFSTVHNHDLPNLYTTSIAFQNSGYCDCVSGYIAYLNNFTQGNTDPLGGNPVTINGWEGCNNGDQCEDFFSDYQTTVISYNNFAVVSGFPIIQSPINYTYQQFVDEGLCNCAQGYVAYLTSAINGYIPLNQFNTGNLYIDDYCDEVEPEVLCDSTFPYQVYSNDTIVPEDPCEYQMQWNVSMNDSILWHEQLVLLTSQFVERYNAHCLGAVEDLTMDYNDREYQFTLYYYDQQGNLIKTVPPAGVEILKDDNDIEVTSYLNPKEQQVIADRTNNTQTVFTEHRLASVYEYNSLNQLVRQSLPDHDKMEICEYTLPNGLDTRLKTTSTHFIDASKGYLTGYVNVGGFNKGFLYATYDAGLTWTLVDDLLGAGINKMQMVDANVGYAVCESGVVLRTFDGGNNWDILNTYANNVTGSLKDLYFTSTSTGVVIGDNGVILRTTNSGTAFVNNSTTSTRQLKAISYSAGTFYIVGQYNNIPNHKSGIMLKSTDGINWTDVAPSAYVSTDQNRVRYLNSTVAAAVGDDGSVMLTSNSGTDWTQINTGINYDFNDVLLKNKDTGIVIITNPLNGNKQEIWRGDFTSEPAVWTTISNTSFSFNGLFPYDNSTNAPKAVAVGNAGRVERVIMAAPPFGTINISPAWPGVPDLYAASTFIYSGNKLFLAVAGKNDTLYFTQNANATNVVWQTVKLTGFTLGVNDYIKSIVLQPFSSTNVLAGVVLLSTGKMYDIRATNFPTTLTFTPCTAYTAPLVADQLFNTLDIVPVAFPNIITQNNDIYAYNSNTVTGKGLYYLTVGDNTVTANTTATIINPSPTTFINMDERSFSVWANGNNRNILVAGSSTTAANGGLIYFGNHTSAAGTMVNNTTTVTPLPFTDVTMKSSSELLTAGVDGSMIYSSNGLTFKTLENDLTSDLSSILYYDNGGNTQYIFASTDGNIYKAPTTGYTTSNTLSAGTSLAPATSVIDIQASSTGYVAFIGNSGTLSLSDDFIPAAPVITPMSNTYGYLNFNGGSFIPGSNDLFVGSSAGMMIKFGTGYSAKVNAIRPGILNDVYFDNSNNGYVVGAGGFYRYTSSGSTSWNVVIPVIDGTTPIHNVYSANTVHMVNATTAVVAGAKTLMAKYNGTSLVYQYHDDAFNANLKDFAFKGNSGIVMGQHTNGNSDIAYYKTFNNSQTWFGAGSIEFDFTGTSGNPEIYDGGSTPVDANSVHIFNNKKFISVGEYGTILYGDLNSTGSAIDPHLNTAGVPASPPSPKFNAVTFVDDIWGYIGGDAGVFWKTSGEFRADDATSNFNSVNWLT